MNTSDNLLSLGFKTLVRFHGERTSTGKPALILKRTGKTFPALLEIMPPLDPDMPLGPDPREHARLHVEQGDDPGLVFGDQLTLSTDSAIVWELLTRDSNPADFVNVYALKRIVPDLDS